MKKNGLFTFFFAFVPGAGQMYLRYMKRGLSLSMIFATLCALCYFLRVELFLFFLPIVWMYSFFDTFNLRAELLLGVAQEDAFLVPVGEEIVKQGLQAIKKNHLWLAWAMIAVGGVMIYHWLLDVLLWNLYGYMDNLFVRMIVRMVENLPSLLFYVLVVCVGVWLVRGAKPLLKANEVMKAEPVSESGIASVSAHSSASSACDKGTVQVGTPCVKNATDADVQAEQKAKRNLLAAIMDDDFAQEEDMAQETSDMQFDAQEE